MKTNHKKETKMKLLAMLCLFLSACTNPAPTIPIATSEIVAAAPCVPTPPVPAPPVPTSDFTPPGKQVQITPGTLAALQAVGVGNTAVMAAGTYVGFSIPTGVSVYSPTVGAAVINGTLKCTGKCNVIGLTINNGQVDLSSNDGSRVSRNTFKGGFNRGDIFGNGAIYATAGKNLMIDHNHFESIATTVLTWSSDNVTITKNEFINVTQGINCEFSAVGHGGHTYSFNYFSGLKRMAIECGTGGAALAYPAFHDVTVNGNYAEKFVWPSTGDTSGNVVYSIVGAKGGQNLSVTGNYGQGTGANSIGIELNATGVVSGNKIDNMGYSCVEVYGPNGFTVKDNNLVNCKQLAVGNYANGTGTISNNAVVTINPPKPLTGPLAP